MERILTIELFGDQYKFQADAEDANAESIIHYLEGKVDEAGKMMTSRRDINKFAQLLLASLTISTEYFEMKEKYENILKQIDQRTSKIVAEIDKSLK